MRKRKATYPPARTATRQPRAPGGPDAPGARPTLVSIDLTARAGGGRFVVGDRVRISGSGLYAGELAVVEALVGGAIPAVLVRTAAGRTRRVRTIDVQRVAEDERPE
jgi:hypothetical protein